MEIKFEDLEDNIKNHLIKWFTLIKSQRNEEGYWNISAKCVDDKYTICNIEEADVIFMNCRIEPNKEKEEMLNKVLTFTYQSLVKVKR